MNERKLFQKNSIKIFKSKKKIKIRPKTDKGITLIALVISIIVMLILAGVSINAVIGDNGIITQAQNATYMQSVAVLEEYLNNFYVEHYEYFEKANNKAEALEQYSESSNWIWNPSKYGYGAIGYIVNEDGNACYLINKQALPEEIKNSLKGGDAGDGTYSDYARMNDVYGVTGNLEVYYCASGKDSILGISEDDLDRDDPLREVLPAGSSIAKLITGDSNKGLTAEDIKSVKTLTIDSTSGVSNLEELYVLTSLEELILDGVNLENLNGISNAIQLYYVQFKNCTIDNYSNLGNVSKLKYLYFYYSTSFENPNNQIEILCSSDKGIANANLSNLQYFGIYGVVPNTQTVANSNNTHTKLTNIEPLANLSDSTKKAVKYMYLNNNSLTSIESLSGFENIYLLRVEQNKLLSLKGCENMNDLTYIHSNNNNLGDNEVYNEDLENNGKNEQEDAISSLKNKAKLYYVRLENNTNLKWIGYLENCTSIRYLYLANNENFINSEVSKIKEIYNTCESQNRSIASKYNILLNSAERIDYTNLDLTDDSIEIEALMNNTTCTQLNLTGNSKLSNSKLQEVLSSMPNLEFLKLYGLTNLTDISFTNNVKKLKELDLRGTNAIDLSLLETNALELKSIWLDNENIDLTKMQETISRLRRAGGTNGCWNTYYVGLGITNVNLYKKLSLCTDITRYERYITSGGAMNVNLDLSNCKKLTYIFSSCAKSSIKIPSSCIEIVLDRESVPDVTNCEALEKFTMNWAEWSQDDFNSFCRQLASATKLKSFSLSATNKNITSISEIKNLKNSQITTLSFNISTSSDLVGAIEDITGVEELKTLTSLSINNHNISDISAMATLTNLKSLSIQNNKVSNIEAISNLKNLQTLNLYKNQISNLKPLSELTNLTYINLNNNCIYDYSTETDESGSSVRYNNLEILANLNKKGALRTLHLANNNGIIDWTPLSSITNWEAHSGW